MPVMENWAKVIGRQEADWKVCFQPDTQFSCSFLAQWEIQCISWSQVGRAGFLHPAHPQTGLQEQWDEFLYNRLNLTQGWCLSWEKLDSDAQSGS